MSQRKHSTLPWNADVGIWRHDGRSALFNPLPVGADSKLSHRAD